MEHAMPRTNGVYSPPAGTKGVPDTTIRSAPYNALVDDLTADANAARPITAGGTGATNATSARQNLGALASADILNAPTKTTPVDADGVVITDSADDGKLKRVLWSRIKAVLKPYFDGIYLALSGGRLTGALSQTSASGGVHIWSTNGTVPTNPTDLTDFLTLYGGTFTSAYGLGVTSGGANGTRLNIVSSQGIAFYTNGSLAMNLDVDNTLRPQGDIFADTRTLRFGTVRALGSVLGSLVHEVDRGYFLLGSYSIGVYGNGSARLWWNNNDREMNVAADNGAGAVGIRANYCRVDAPTAGGHAANRDYVDNLANARVSNTRMSAESYGGTITPGNEWHAPASAVVTGLSLANASAAIGGFYKTLQIFINGAWRNF